MLRRVWKLCPSRWHRYSVDNLRHPLDVLADLDLYNDDRGHLSQHGSWCMDVLYTEACKRAGLMNKGKHYVTIGNEAYSLAGDDLLSNEQKASLGWSGNHYDQYRVPS